jgi:hypothetical protein
MDAVRSLGFSETDFRTDFFAPAQPDTLLVYCGWGDIDTGVYEHLTTGRRIAVPLRGVQGGLTNTSPEYIDRCIESSGLNNGDRIQLRDIINVLTTQFRYIGRITNDVMETQLRQIFAAIPANALLLALSADEYCKIDGAITTRARAISYNGCLQRVIKDFDNVQLVGIREYVKYENEMQKTDHFDRIVWRRLANGILKKYWETRGRSAISGALQPQLAAHAL